jgi:putative FmdB family regulatory protein
VPIYEYECDEQGHRFEKWRSVQDEPVTTCPICGGTVHKLFLPTGIIFKGSGWYSTDSRKSSSASETTETSKSETKKEKPASESKGSSGEKD